MKEIIETKKVIVGYEANDGTQFSSKRECAQYEYFNLPMLIITEADLLAGYGSHVDKFHIIPIKDIDTIQIINDFLEDEGFNKLTDDMIGTIQIISVGDDVFYGIIGTPENLKKSIEQNIDAKIRQLRYEMGKEENR